MSLWEPLVADALVGTARRPPTPPGAAGALGDLLARTTDADPETALLAAAATVDTYRRAGRRPAHDPEPLPDPCTTDPRPRAPARAGGLLARLLAGEHRGVLAEWLALADAGGWRAPEEHVPALLEAGRGDAALRAAVATVAGPLGRWLGAQRARWAWASGGEDPAGTWATGSAAARRLALATLRAADPDAARALLDSTWDAERADDRARFVAELATGLSDADEPFLEAALDDRGREVRRVAADLLARLPDSGLARRMTERTDGLVAVEGRRRRRRLLVRLPADPDAAAQRDGVVPTPPAGRGASSWQLEQLLAATPLAAWVDRLGAPPEELVPLAAGTEHAAALLSGWATAAVRQRDAAWAAALYPHTGRPDLLAVVGGAQAEQQAVTRLDRDGATVGSLAAAAACPSPWGVRLSRAALGALAATTRRPPGDDGYALRERLVALGIGLRLDPALAAEASAGLAEPDPLWQRPVAQLLDTLSFRAAVHDALRPRQGPADSKVHSP